jgi:hypothetical protein
MNISTFFTCKEGGAFFCHGAASAAPSLQTKRLTVFSRGISQWSVNSKGLN